MPEQPSVKEVRVTASARLHLGFLDMNGGLGRKFGGLGLAIGGPRTRIELTRGDAATLVEGLETERAGRLLEKVVAAFAPQAGKYHLVVHEAIPAHAGLGSGTQLALAIAAALRRLEDIPLDAAADAALMERGARSGLGAGLFQAGGLVVDGGRGARGLTPPVVARLPFPSEWRVLLVFDKNAEGLSGDREREAFSALPPFSAAQAGELCRRVLLQALPAVAERDIAAFGEAITQIQHIVGDYFAPAQSGRRFTSRAVEAMISRLLAEGAVGGGQTSWGPTGFAFADSEAEARRLVQAVAGEAAAGLSLEIVEGVERGASVDAVYARIA
jgi:beta-ribofuranosylaminobenzene 5'-phosphate synthase